ncbi:MAG: hypothetical protein JWQ35_374 [Bacteriovoracaceae bacterium]|nr:hypothetical protein [Bacteriovoracaceae bacterium]
MRFYKIVGFFLLFQFSSNLFASTRQELIEFFNSQTGETNLLINWLGIPTMLDSLQAVIDSHNSDPEIVRAVLKWRESFPVTGNSREIDQLVTNLFIQSSAISLDELLVNKFSTRSRLLRNIAYERMASDYKEFMDINSEAPLIFSTIHNLIQKGFLSEIPVRDAEKLHPRISFLREETSKLLELEGPEIDQLKASRSGYFTEHADWILAHIEDRDAVGSFARWSLEYRPTLVLFAASPKLIRTKLGILDKLLSEKSSLVDPDLELGQAILKKAFTNRIEEMTEDSDHVFELMIAHGEKYSFSKLLFQRAFATSSKMLTNPKMRNYALSIVKARATRDSEWEALARGLLRAAKFQTWEGDEIFKKEIQDLRRSWYVDQHISEKFKSEVLDDYLTRTDKIVATCKKAVQFLGIKK